jgi:hypothetical protein
MPETGLVLAFDFAWPLSPDGAPEVSVDTFLRQPADYARTVNKVR